MGILKEQDDLEKAKEALKVFDLAESRAKELSAVVPKRKLFVGIQGIDLAINHFDFREGFSCIRSVTNPPGIVHVSRAADLQETDYLGVSRYSSRIVAEIAIGNERLKDHDFLFGMAWHAAALLKLRGHARLTCPIAATVSWDVVCAASDHSIHFHLLDDVPRYFSLLPKQTTVSVHRDNAFTRLEIGSEPASISPAGVHLEEKMDSLTFISNLVQHLTWPTVVLAIYANGNSGFVYHLHGMPAIYNRNR